MLRKPVRPIERAVSNLAGRDLVRSKVCASGARADRLDGFVRNVVAAGEGRSRFEAQTDLVMVSGGNNLPAGLSAVETGPGVLEDARSGERRVGKECRSRWSPYHYKKKN